MHVTKAETNELDKLFLCQYDFRWIPGKVGAQWGQDINKLISMREYIDLLDFVASL